MTRAEAIHHLETYSTTHGSGLTTDKQHNEAKRMAIEALSQEPKRADWKLGEVAGLECTNCGWEIDGEKEMTNYCPSCGCFMGYQ